MRIKSLPVSRLFPSLFAAAVMAMATPAVAEAPPRNTGAITITPEMIRQSTKAAQPTKNLSTRTHGTYETHYVLAGANADTQYHPGSCAQKSTSLCFDYRTGSARYKPMRKLLPDIPGMTPHNLSIRRNRIVAEYTFK